VNEAYLGDGLYASFDGFSIKLRAPREHGDHEVYLEPDMLIGLIRTAKEWYGPDAWEKIEKMS
jgi:hypothetical protein